MASKDSQNGKDRHINFALMRDRVLSQESGKKYWRSLEELANSPELDEFVRREFPSQADEWDDPVGRRTFLKLMGASLALAGLSSCTYQPPEKIIPYVRQPEEMVPGKPLFFATAMTLTGIATGLLAKSNEGRPTKIEGNELHPDSLGATDIFSQASILDLYDPDRSKTITYREEIRPWSTFLGEIRKALEEQKPKQGAGIRILTETVSSPTLASQLKSILTDYPAAKWHQYEPAARNNVTNGATLAFGQPVNTIYRFATADRILSIGSDFLACGPGSLRQAREFSAKRRLTEGKTDMNRLYVAESSPTNTGAKADHRLSLRPSEMEGFARAVAAGVGANLGASNGNAPTSNPAHAQFITALANDLKQHAGACIVIPGDEQPPVIHAIAHAINAALGNVGKTVFYTDSVEANAIDQTSSLRELMSDIDSGLVDLLVIIGGNPVYNAPVDFQFAERLQKVKLRAHLSYHKDETSELCHWNIPETHYLEAWSDARAFDGTVSIVQPLIAPLYEGKSAHELLTAFSEQSDRKGYDIVKDFWQSQAGGGGSQGTGDGGRAILTAPLTNATTDFEMAWRKAVHDGVMPNTALPAKTFALKTDWANQPSAQTAPQSPASGSQLEIIFRTDPTIYDGRFANNGWLQELPKPLTKLTWDNAAMMSEVTATRLGLGSEIGRKGGDHYSDTIDLTLQGRTLQGVPVWILPGQPDDVVTVHLGYGRTRVGRVGDGQGFNAYKLRTSDAPWQSAGLQVKKAGGQYGLATTQLHFNMEDRDPVKLRTLDEIVKNPDSPKEKTEGHGERESEASKDDSMYPQYDYKNQGNGYAWGMAIDNMSCVGCNACVVACQSENNIPVVGKVQVQRSREMHWIRIDAYYTGKDSANPEGPYFMPVPCMHCENAPCEPVCPVHATVHSAEGTNDMAYNRCVGTRYCSNNCPYKVRHFNFLLYQDWTTPTYQLMRNPEVSVRSRGVMEKCTYCIQRIQWAKIDSENEGRRVRDGEIVTACQAVCPTEAIVFGDINDPNSRVSKMKAEERNYSLLADLNTQPRTTYLSEVRNPNPELTEKA
jgi:molybdopterin-containing oxidoreductase family iron-sulfur binding subunit